MTAEELRAALAADRSAPWTRWPDAYGAASDAPDHLLALLDGDEPARRRAVGYLGSAIVHQSTIWPATPNALARVLDVLDAAALPEATLAGCLEVFTEAADYLDQVEASEVPELSPGARKLLDDWATADADEFDPIWDGAADEELDELNRWAYARLLLLRPRVLALAGRLAGGPLAEPAARTRDAWTH